MQSSMNEPLLRIQREISEVVEREQELRKRYKSISISSDQDDQNELQIDHNANEKKNDSIELLPTRLLRAKSMIQLNNLNTYKPPPMIGKRFPTEQRGIMQRFIKSRGKLSLGQPITMRDPIARSWSMDATSNDIHKPIHVRTEKFTRKGYVPVEERIQRELREMQNREAELRAHQRKVLATSQPDLLEIINSNECSDDSRASTPKLRGARSYLELDQIDSASNCGTTMSAPASLRPALSLAQLCDGDFDESQVPSSSELIAKFENIIKKNLTNGNS